MYTLSTNKKHGYFIRKTEKGSKSGINISHVDDSILHDLVKNLNNNVPIIKLSKLLHHNDVLETPVNLKSIHVITTEDQKVVNINNHKHVPDNALSAISHLTKAYTEEFSKKLDNQIFENNLNQELEVLLDVDASTSSDPYPSATDGAFSFELSQLESLIAQYEGEKTAKSSQITGNTLVIEDMLISSDHLNLSVNNISDTKFNEITYSSASAVDSAPAAFQYLEYQDEESEENNNVTDNESNYFPDQSSSESSVNDLQVGSKTTRSSINSSSIANSTNVSLNTSTNTVGCTLENIKVKSSEPKGVNKKHFCIYCKTLQTKIARHLEIVHKNEEEVKKFIFLPKGSLERRKIIDTIRKNGDFLHNKDGHLNTGEIIVCRRPVQSKNKKSSDFITCPNCHGCYTKNNLRHHFSVCSDKKLGRHVQVFGRKVEARVHKSASEMMRNVIIPVMREDEVTSCVRHDELIILRGNKVCAKFRNQRHHDMIRAELRLLGRFLISVKKFNANVTDLISIYKLPVYDACLAAVHEVARFDPETNKFGAPSVATRLGTMLKKIGNLLFIEMMKKDDKEGGENVTKFLKLLDQDYSESINKTAEETVTMNNRLKTIELPSKEDVKKLYNFIEKERNIFFNELKISFTIETWTELLKLVLISILIYNRRRTGETEKILIEDFRCIKTVSRERNSEVYDAMTPSEKKAVENFATFDIRGKLGRTVPVLLYKHIRECIELLLNYRSRAKVKDSNPYLFGIFGTDKHRHAFLRGCKLLREYSEKCGASKPLTLRGTKLRKHIATLCIRFNLSENEVASLSTFMGHDKTIHRSHYRQSIPEFDILRFSRLLNAAVYNDNEDNNVVPENNRRNPFQDCDAMESENDSNTIDTPKTSAADSKRKRSTSPFGATKRRRWTDTEKTIIKEAFQYEISQLRLPSQAKILELKSKTPQLQNRTTPQIKTWLHNLISGKIKRH